MMRPAGYSALIERFGLDVVPNWHVSFVGGAGERNSVSKEGMTLEVFPVKYWPGDNIGDHLEFALKYDGVNLGILSLLFEKADRKDILRYIGSKPAGKYARRIWYFFELLTGDKLSIGDLTRCNYIDLLDSDRYFSVTPGRKVRRQRINDNLPGDRRFCPLVRRTEIIRNFEERDLQEQGRKVIESFPADLIGRAVGYLYTRETRSSFEIERIRPSSGRFERFAALLRLAGKEDFLSRNRLVELQNMTVDPRFRENNYRECQNYVGESVDLQRERIHYIPPGPKDIRELMEGLFVAHKRMSTPDFPAVIHAAVVSYGFVFLHPFDDGNGRIHRFLVHNILARRGFTPAGVIFPVSASMLLDSLAYNGSLESFSKILMPLIDHSLDEQGRMTVHNDTARWYRYIDMTAQAEALYRFLDETINRELPEELEFLAAYDKARSALREIVDMPDRLTDFFIRFCRQNGGKLSSGKRAAHFDFLSDEEVMRMETAVAPWVKRESGTGARES